jgi:hypothetical protein
MGAETRPRNGAANPYRAWPLRNAMAVVVLLRGANLGSKRFSSKAVETELADLAAKSIGAAGTFVIKGRVAQKTLRARFVKALPFEPDLFVVEGSAVPAALEAGEALSVPSDARRFATLLGTPPAKKPSLPIEAPPGAAWGVRVLALNGPFALGVRRSFAVTGVYPNEVVEKAFGVRATTRDWPTLEKIAGALA